MKNKLMLLGVVAFAITMQNKAISTKDLQASLLAAQIRGFDVEEMMRELNVSPEESDVALGAFNKTQKKPLEEFLSKRIKPVLSKVKANASENEIEKAITQQPIPNRESKIAFLQFMGNIGSFYLESLSNENNAEDACDRQFVALLLHHVDSVHGQIGSDVADIINPGTGNPSLLAQQMINAIE